MSLSENSALMRSIRIETIVRSRVLKADTPRMSMSTHRVYAREYGPSQLPLDSELTSDLGRRGFFPPVFWWPIHYPAVAKRGVPNYGRLDRRRRA